MRGSRGQDRCDGYPATHYLTRFDHNQPPSVRTSPTTTSPSTVVTVARTAQTWAPDRPPEGGHVFAGVGASIRTEVIGGCDAGNVPSATVTAATHRSAARGPHSIAEAALGWGSVDPQAATSGRIASIRRRRSRAIVGQYRVRVERGSSATPAIQSTCGNFISAGPHGPGDGRTWIWAQARPAPLLSVVPAATT